MGNFVFLGDYETNAAIPDVEGEPTGRVVLVQPGETVDIDSDDPGPLWAKPTTSEGKAAKARAKAAAKQKPRVSVVDAEGESAEQDGAGEDDSDGDDTSDDEHGEDATTE